MSKPLQNFGENDNLSVQNYFGSYNRVIHSLPYFEIDAVVDLLVAAREEGRSIFVFGNGGSAALASHFACDLGKGTPRHDPSRLFRVISLCDNIPVLTAWGNDKSYDSVFAEQLKNFMVPGDIAFAISGSGNSPNVLRALETARQLGGVTVGLGGFAGGKMKRLCDHCMVVPSDSMQIVEDFHLSICHAVFLAVCGKIERPSQMAVAAGSAVHSD